MACEPEWNTQENGSHGGGIAMSWSEKLTKIKDAIKKVQNTCCYIEDGVRKVKEHPVLDPVTRFALGAIPGVGSSLLDWYNKVEDTEENKIEEILKFLELSQNANEKRYQEVSIYFETKLDAIIKNRVIITDLMTKRFDEIDEQLKGLKHDTVEIKKTGKKILIDTRGLKEEFQRLSKEFYQFSEKQKLSTPSPKITDLFEIIRNPADVLSAIFRTGHGEALAPFEVPYITERESIANIQDKLYRTLLASGGALLVQSRGGLGKTREVAELAKKLCKEKGWTVCVAKGEGDSQIDTPANFPDELRGKKVLFVFDDLHLRIKSGPSPYSERLDNFLKFFEDTMNSGEMYVVATARSEPQYLEKLRSDTSKPLWKWFKVYELPEFSSTSLQTLLEKLAESLNVDIDETQINQMISKSDKTSRTLILNVEQAHNTGQKLTLDNWRPSQLESWVDRFELARGKWPVVEQVYDALHLVREAWLPTRFEYVVQLANKLSGKEVTLAAKDLVNRGILGLRNDILDTFGDEQLRDSLQAAGTEPPELTTYWDIIIETIMPVVESKSEWTHDLFYITVKLIFSNRFKDAELVSTLAISQGHDTPYIFMVRGIARRDQENYVEAEGDFTTALDRGFDDPGIYSERGMTLYFQGEYSRAEEDFTTAINLGLQDSLAYRVRGIVRYYQDNYEGAEEDFTAAIARDKDNGELYYYRGLARHYLDNNAGAEKDFTTAIKKGKVDEIVYYTRGGTRYQLGDHVGAEEDLTKAIKQDKNDTEAYYLRGEVRIVQSDFAGAEEDFKKAIDQGCDNLEVYRYLGWTQLELGDYVGAEKYLTIAIKKEKDKKDSSLYLARSRSRTLQGKYPEAEKDITEAIKRGEDTADIFWGRHRIRFILENYKGAEEDLTSAIEKGRDDAAIYQNRSFINIILGRLDQARQDCKYAEERAPDDPFTSGCWGDLHLALGEYDKAITRYQSALKIQPESKWHFSIGLGMLFADRFDEAIKAYQKGLDGASPNYITEAISDIDFWTQYHPDRVADPEAKNTINTIRQELKNQQTQR